jgi:hypothetical protein
MKSELKKYILENILDSVSGITEEDPQGETGQDWETEPQGTEVGSDKSSEDIYVDQEKLQQLLDKKDVILMQYKSGQMSLDDYRNAIGNLPQQIKHLRDKIAAATEVGTDDLEPEM